MATLQEASGTDLELAATQVHGPMYYVWRSLRSNNSARVGAVIILLFALAALLAPIVHPYNARRDLNLRERLQPPSRSHPFGTDDKGRDVLVRVVHGGRVSLRVGFSAVLLALSVGTAIGLTAGQLGGWVDSLLMRTMDIVLAFPSTLLAIAIVAMRGPGLGNTMLAVGIVGIPIYARLARSMALQIREQEFVVAARSIGVGETRILIRHLLPNSLSPLIVQATLGIGTAVLEAAALGFLGLGQQPPFPEWGAMLSDGYKFLTSGSWWVLLFPGLAIMLTVLGFNLLGDGLRDALDPRLRGV
ncbi:MAG TPA: ABC transporter permease [Anaerolineae bacterium]|nr:ABC transporter permease [Anaerolineae bacterium]